ncbi:hypothetical protein CLOSTHATH_03005 [Hungatella hathewayi DSM 13479]|uniref:Uncharacterized protein n=1 Tax=Hungatella hathewayi DSM 13479 TaxID=566550 RepID=D3AHB7_9FIRM|nr:hypothetical protein CLOSTHATH_03005 [Hungatella hathewayi DSM 13479]
MGRRYPQWNSGRCLSHLLRLPAAFPAHQLSGLISFPGSSANRPVSRTDNLNRI